MSTAAGEGAAATGILTRGRLWLLGFATTVVAVLVSVAHLDRPVALIAQDWFGGLPVVTAFMLTAGFFNALVIAVLALVALRRLARRPFGRADVVILLCDVSLLIGYAAKAALKYVFGRTWPKYGHPTLIHDGAYGFHPFHAGSGFESFPSGHMTATCALLSVLWIYYPRFRPLYAACASALATALVAGDYHFLSDVIAGSFLGASIGVGVASAWDAVRGGVYARA
jgi:membrane-associated phospholipid phosphatase